MNPFRVIIYISLIGVFIYAANIFNEKLALGAVISIFVLWIISWIVKNYGKNT